MPGTPLLAVAGLASFAQAIEGITEVYRLHQHQASYLKEAFLEQLLNEDGKICFAMKAAEQERTARADREIFLANLTAALDEPTRMPAGASAY